MKLALVLAAALASTACTGISFSRKSLVCTTGASPTCKENEIADKDIAGLPFHESKPFLLVTRSGAKDGGVESKIIYLPDLTTTYYAKPEPVLIGSAAFTLTLTDGRLASFNGEVSADLAGLLADLVSPVKGLAEADASRAAGALSRAEAAKIMNDINKSAGINLLNLTEKNNNLQALGLNPASVCAANIPVPTTHNPQLNGEQARTVALAAANLLCAYETASPLTKAILAEAAVTLIKVYLPDFPASPAAVALKLGGDNPTALALRAVATELKEVHGEEATNRPGGTTVKGLALEAANAITKVADEIDPKPVTPPAKPYQLYEIIIDPATKKVALRPVEELKGQ